MCRWLNVFRDIYRHFNNIHFFCHKEFSCYVVVLCRHAISNKNTACSLHEYIVENLLFPYFFYTYVSYNMTYYLSRRTFERVFYFTKRISWVDVDIVHDRQRRVRIFAGIAIILRVYDESVRIFLFFFIGTYLNNLIRCAHDLNKYSLFIYTFFHKYYVVILIRSVCSVHALLNLNEIFNKFRTIYRCPIQKLSDKLSDATKQYIWKEREKKGIA